MYIKLNISILYWYFQQSQYLNLRKTQYTTYIDKHGAPMLMGPGKLPSVPMRSDGTEYTPLLHPSNVNVKDLQTTLDAM